MADNVLILGAGFSHDAGIPMLGGFVERMWEYAVRGEAAGKKLSELERDVLTKALEVRTELDGYHGRATFDDRNIEDILSILAFNVLGGGASERKKLDAVTRAIATTIELSCNVKHPGIPSDGRYTAVSEGAELYRQFWRGLFKWVEKGNDLPNLITFKETLINSSTLTRSKQ